MQQSQEPFGWNGSVIVGGGGNWIGLILSKIVSNSPDWIKTFIELFETDPVSRGKQNLFSVVPVGGIPERSMVNLIDRRKIEECRKQILF